jgi:HK97 family phage portal protein
MPGLLARIGRAFAPVAVEESRTIGWVPWNVGGLSAETVTQDRALGLPAVMASVRHIADFGSTLPLKGYRQVGEDRVPMATLPKLFEDLRSAGDLIPWLSCGLASLVVHGNAIGLIIERDGFGFPTSVQWVAKSRVHVDDSSGLGRWFIDGRAVDRSTIVHIPWLTVPGRTLALSPLETYAATVNAGLGAQAYGSQWFDNGGVPPGTFKNSQKTITPAMSEEIRDRLTSSIRTGKPLVYGTDWDFNAISIPPNQAQFVETQKLTANQIAAIYGIEPQEIGGEAANGLTYNNEELRQTKRLANMRPYLTRFEHAFASWLPSAQYVKFNGDAIIRADIKTRYETYQIARQIGLLTVNEERALEELPPVAGGDVAVPAQVQQQAQQAPDNPATVAPIRRIQ